MNKESIFELQKVDCNCNDCAFMVRNMDKYKLSIETHHKWQLDYFNSCKQKLIDKANWWRDAKGDLEKWNTLLIEAKAMKFQFNKKTVSTHFGKCSKFNKDISFIPNVCQLETQQCFMHRREEK